MDDHTDIRKFAKRVISRQAKTRIHHRVYRPSYNARLKGNRWQSVKLKSQDPITSISISPEVGTNGCGEVTPRVNKRIRRNRSFHIRFSLFDVLEIVDGGEKFRSVERVSLPERSVSGRGNLKIDGGNLTIGSLYESTACTGEIHDEQLIELFREMERTNEPLEPHRESFPTTWANKWSKL